VADGEEEGDGYHRFPPRLLEGVVQVPPEEDLLGQCDQQEMAGAIAAVSGTVPWYGEIAGGRGRRTNRKKATAPAPASSAKNATLPPGSVTRAHAGKPRRQ
jgi:hypothetical protein